MKWTLVVVLVAGCREAHAQLPDAPTARLASVSHTKWAPVPPGFIRIDLLGVDIQSPHAGAMVYPDIDWAEIAWSGPRGTCDLRLIVAPGESADRKIVGTLPLTCTVSGEGCGACGEIRPIHGGPAEEPYPTEPPAIDIESSWGDRTKDHAGRLVWRDGTVQFWGEECTGYRGRRGNLPAARVAALVEALERAGLLTLHVEPQRSRDPMCEHSITWFTLRSTTRKNSIRSSCELSEPIRRAISLVDKVVGRNPCLPDG